MLSHEVKESIERTVKFEFDNEHFALIMDFFYTSNIDINESNVEGVMLISNYLQV